MPVVRPVGEARFGKTRLAREGADPVAVKKGVKMGAFAGGGGILR